MSADSVEREILIEASPEVVWGVITEPEQISRWFSDEADVDGRAGTDGTLTWKPGEEGRARYVEDHARGWERHLGELHDYVASTAGRATR